MVDQTPAEREPGSSWAERLAGGGDFPFEFERADIHSPDPFEDESELDMAEPEGLAEMGGEWNLVGPFFVLASLAESLSIPESEVVELADRGDILALHTAEDRDVYPVRQFGKDNSLLPGLKPVLEVLRSGETDEWTAALFLLAHNSKTGSIADRLRGGDIEGAISQARHAVASWNG
jgi:hypothetical protein